MLAVLISNFNHSNYIEDTLNSLVRSDSVDKIFITDDGSEDNSVKVINRFRNSCNKLEFISDSFGNLGYSNRINLYYELLNDFEFGMFLDSDDRILPKGLKLALRALERNQYDAIFSSTALISADGMPQGIIDGLFAPHFDYPEEISRCCVSGGQTSNCNGILNTLLHQNWVRTSSNILFRTDKIAKFMPMPNLRNNPDWYFALSLAISGNTSYSRIPFSEHRVHNQNVTSLNYRDSMADAKILFEKLDLLNLDSKSFGVHALLAISENLYIKDPILKKGN